MPNRAPRVRPCGPRAGLLLPKLPHSRTVLSSSTGVADSQRVNGGWSRSSAAAPRGAGQLWAEPAAPHPRGGPRSRSHSQTNSTRETFRSQSAADSAPCSSPARRDTVPAPPAQTPAPHTHPVRGALPPLGPGSRPRTRPPAPRAPPPARACAPWPRWRGGGRAPTGLMLRPGIVGGSRRPDWESTGWTRSSQGSVWEGPLPSRSLTSAMAERARGRRRPRGSPDAVPRAYWRRSREAEWGGAAGGA